ncbi:MAG TPA: amidohydrolase family protein [Steroidobacteraceae bacterium]|nr:amidohydrolase family protein [Steroidobacteraceae bacterium]
MTSGSSKIFRAWLAFACVFAGATCNAQTATGAAGELAPEVDHHQHLLSPQGAALANSPNNPPEIPPEVAQLLRQREDSWNDPGRLAGIYSEDALTLNVDEQLWVHGRSDVAAYLGTRFARPYQFTPIAYTGDDRRARLAVYYSRGDGPERRHIGSAMLELVREDGQWRIATEYPIFPGPPREEPLDGQRLVSMLDAAHIKRAVVLSVGYWFDSPLRPSARSAAAMRAENDWTADQAARFPDRLVAFCSLNPVSDAAAAELRHCIDDKRFKGLKLHFANSQVDLLNADQVGRIREVFAAANRARLPIVVHVRNGDAYGAREAHVFLEQLLTAAPDVPVQIAHLWGGGGFSAEALAVYAEAVAARSTATRRLYFDVSDAALATNSTEFVKVVADRIRQIGLDRILYGSDAAFENHPDPQGSWTAFRNGIPLSAAEFEKIAHNVAPYLREPR